LASCANEFGDAREKKFHGHWLSLTVIIREAPVKSLGSPVHPCVPRSMLSAGTC
jgi:hypothetical protein